MPVLPKTRKIISSILILFGLLCLTVPFALDLADSHTKKLQIEENNQAAAAFTREQRQEQILAAQTYNQTLLPDSPKYPLSDSQKQQYESLLNPAGDGIMGAISIPEIDVNLPVYHTTGDAVLNAGVGHLEGSSLPAGGAGSHAILYGHRGIPGSTLFTRLNEIKEGDLFYLEVMGEKLAYQVDQIQILQPEDNSYCVIEPGKDLVTLVTCTPFGINNKRLVITGTRTQVPPEAQEKTSSYSKISILVLITGLLLAGLWITVLLRRQGKSRHPANPEPKPKSVTDTDAEKGQNQESRSSQ